MQDTFFRPVANSVTQPTLLEHCCSS